MSLPKTPYRKQHCLVVKKIVSCRNSFKATTLRLLSQQDALITINWTSCNLNPNWINSILSMLELLANYYENGTFVTRLNAKYCCGKQNIEKKKKRFSRKPETLPTQCQMASEHFKVCSMFFYLNTLGTVTFASSK